MTTTTTGPTRSINHGGFTYMEGDNVAFTYRHASGRLTGRLVWDPDEEGLVCHNPGNWPTSTATGRVITTLVVLDDDGDLGGDITDLRIHGEHDLREGDRVVLVREYRTSGGPGDGGRGWHGTRWDQDWPVGTQGTFVRYEGAGTSDRIALVRWPTGPRPSVPKRVWAGCLRKVDGDPAPTGERTAEQILAAPRDGDMLVNMVDGVDTSQVALWQYVEADDGWAYGGRRYGRGGGRVTLSHEGRDAEYVRTYRGPVRRLTTEEMQRWFGVDHYPGEGDAPVVAEEPLPTDVAELQERIRTMQREHEERIATIASDAIRMAQQHDMCTQVERFLREHDMQQAPRRAAFEITVRIPVEATYDGGWSYGPPTGRTLREVMSLDPARLREAISGSRWMTDLTVGTPTIMEVSDGRLPGQATRPAPPF